MKNAKIKSLAVLLTALSIANFNTGWTNTGDRVKDAIDSVAKTLKKEVDKLGENKEAIQNYLNNYDWKGIVQDHASSDPVTLKHLKMNGQSKAVAVLPGEKIDCEVRCDLDREKCSAFSLYRVVMGIKGEGAQTTIGNELGIVAGESVERFSLHAPSQPGFYEVRFKVVKSLRENKAIESWKDDHGKEPKASTTVGIIFVK